MKTSSKWPLDRVKQVEVLSDLSIFKFDRMTEDTWAMRVNDKFTQSIGTEALHDLLNSYESVGCLVMPISGDVETKPKSIIPEGTYRITTGSANGTKRVFTRYPDGWRQVTDGGVSRSEAFMEELLKAVAALQYTIVFYDAAMNVLKNITPDDTIQ